MNLKIMEEIAVKTPSGVMIVGNFEEVRPDHGAALLLHMMPATKESYEKLQTMLGQAKISSLAIDLRGHGKSVFSNAGLLDFHDFSDREHQNSIEDVNSSVEWLLSATGFEKTSLILIGASIGANLALQYAAANTTAKNIVALSPGLNYRGIATMPLVKALVPNQRLLLAASKEDTESAEAVEKLAEVSLAATEVLMFENAGHGTNMFDTEPELLNRLVEWAKIGIKA